MLREKKSALIKFMRFIGREITWDPAFSRSPRHQQKKNFKKNIKIRKLVEQLLTSFCTKIQTCV